MDAQCSRYSASIRVQTGRAEMIKDLSSMIVELLKVFFQTCGAKPERIVFYRDGLTEGQCSEVLAYEVDAIRRACATLDPNYRPTLTFIVVQKRHHARFFPIRKEDSDKSGNVLPGTVVESGVTHPSGIPILTQNLISTFVRIPVCKERVNLHITTFSGTKIISLLILCRNSPTVCVICIVEPLAVSVYVRLPITRTLLLLVPGSMLRMFLKVRLNLSVLLVGWLG